MAVKHKRASNLPRWYSEGLDFECQPDCGACCTNHDDYAYVYLEGDDLSRLADFLGIGQEEILKRYATEQDGLTMLRMDEPTCLFLDGNRCTVYPARPTQCRTFPFWHENLRNKSAWERLCGFCPGINRGPRHDLISIEEQLSARRIDE